MSEQLEKATCKAKFLADKITLEPESALGIALYAVYEAGWLAKCEYEQNNKIDPHVIDDKG